MNKTVIVAVLAALLTLVPGCQPGPSTPASSPTPVGGAAGGAEDTGAVGVLESGGQSAGHFMTMVEMLRGRVSGLQVSEAPNGDISLRIRGTSSFMADEQPLLVIDGVPVPTYAITSTLRTLDPQDVRTIQVLKDTGSTSAYGVRGANGVILITLRRPGGTP
jgi:TonB-dependent SusC/RagA subfamily outer membrane receptor